MEARAKRKYIRTSPRKMRIVANVVRGKNVSDALRTLHFLPQKSTREIELAIQSAVANLIDQNDDARIDVDGLVLKTIQVDEAPFLKRFIPVSRGRAHPILKRSSHLTVVVAEPTEDLPAESRTIRSGERVAD